MAIFLEEEGKMPKDLVQLNNIIKKGREGKKQLFQEIAAAINVKFNTNFTFERVQRKWNTLLDSYKKIKDSTKQTGAEGPEPYSGKFRYYQEMDSLMAGRHDIVPVCTGTAAGIVTKEKSNKPVEVPKQPKRPRKRESGNLEQLVDYLRERDEIEDRQSERLLNGMTETNNVLKELVGLIPRMLQK